MKITQDFHIHTHCSCDSANSTIDEIVKGCQAAGIKEFGISDHLHTKFNMPDLEIARKEFLEYGPVPGFHFGIEVTCATQWECEKIAKRDFASCFTCEVNGKPFQTMTPIDGIMYGGPANGPLMIDLTKEDMDRLGIEYVIGGVHWPLYSKPEEAYEDFFRQQMYLIEHPLVDILAHPWDAIELAAGGWYMNRDKEHINYDAILNIPEEYNEKLMNALLKHQKCAELNLAVLLSAAAPEKCRKYYWNLFAQWREAGVKFTIGSDQHSSHYNPVMFSAAELILDAYGFKESDIKYFFSQN